MADTFANDDVADVSLEDVLGFRIVGALREDGSGAQMQRLAMYEDAAGRPRAGDVASVQPASGRELLMYSMLLEMWNDTDPARRVQVSEKVGRPI